MSSICSRCNILNRGPNARYWCWQWGDSDEEVRKVLLTDKCVGFYPRPGSAVPYLDPLPDDPAKRGGIYEAYVGREEPSAAHTHYVRTDEHILTIGTESHCRRVFKEWQDAKAT